MPRADGRQNNELRPVTMSTGYNKYAEGSCLIEAGDTVVICTASVLNEVPRFLAGRQRGWVTAEYSMLPRAGAERTRAAVAPMRSSDSSAARCARSWTSTPSESAPSPSTAM